MADLDLSAYSGTQFNIIGTRYGDAFTGVFDGNGHIVSNFRHTSPGRDTVGLFGYIRRQNARIKDLLRKSSLEKP